MNHDVKDILTNLGYSLTDSGPYYRAKPLYRDSSSHTVLSIKKDSGRWIDFKEQKYGNIEDLIQLTLNLKNLEEAKQYLSSNFQFSIPKAQKEKLEFPKTFNKENLNHIIPCYSYWNNRGVSSDTLKLFESGIMRAGKMKDRYVFPIFDSRDRFVGAAGRDITNKQSIKWKLVGHKGSWAYPLKYNLEHLRKRQVILVESIGDMLALWENRIRNTIVTFGLNITPKIKRVLMAIDPVKIYIAFNNDANHAGNDGAKKAYKNLLQQFDPTQLEIKLPPKNDFGCMSKEEIFQWKNQLPT